MDDSQPVNKVNQQPEQNEENNTNSEGHALVPEKSATQFSPPSNEVVSTTATEEYEDPPMPEEASAEFPPESIDFMAPARAVSQLVGAARSVLNHPHLQSAVPVLRHVTAFMAAFPPATEPYTMPTVDINQLSRAVDQLVFAREKMPEQHEHESPCMSFADPCVDEDDVNDAKSVGSDAPFTNASHQPAFEEALAENMQRLIESSA